jgi:hypothetical protein
MTLPPEKIGDKGQRFRVLYSGVDDPPDVRHVLGYCPTEAGAMEMARAWSTHHEDYEVWIEDRQA